MATEATITPATPDFDPAPHLIDLKGKKYLPAQARLLWLNTAMVGWPIVSFEFQPTEFLSLDDTHAVARVVVRVYGPDGQFKQGCGTKREDRAHFADFMEKAETSAKGRALADLGFGTQFTDTDEVASGRIADSPQPSRSATTSARPGSNGGAGSDMPIRFGTAKGKTVADIEDSSIGWYLEFINEGMTPGHKRYNEEFLDSNSKLYDAIIAEGIRRGLYEAPDRN